MNDQIEELTRNLSDRLARVLGPFIERRIAAETRRPAGRKRARRLCPFPGCKNTFAPRFGGFCAALHKNLSAREKARIKAQASA